MLAALGKQLRRAVMQNVSSSPTQPSRMTCEAPSGLRGKSYATCISSPPEYGRECGVCLLGGVGSMGARRDLEGGSV